jgi:hypothetical protein
VCSKRKSRSKAAFCEREVPTKILCHQGIQRKLGTGDAVFDAVGAAIDLLGQTLHVVFVGVAVAWLTYITLKMRTIDKIGKITAPAIFSM